MEKKILWAEIEIIPFIHFYPPGYFRARGTLWIKFIKDYSLPIQMKSFGPPKNENEVYRDYVLSKSGNILLFRF